MQVFEELSISPGEHTVDYANRCDARREQQAQKCALPSAKRERLIRAKERAMTQDVAESREGTTYASSKYYMARKFVKLVSVLSDAIM